MLLVLLACAGVIIYAVFLLNPANRGDWLPYARVMLAESILVAHALLAMGWRATCMRYRITPHRRTK